jgi:ADP-ribose pyrophosphatase YjhB (NUDIX family)
MRGMTLGTRTLVLKEEDREVLLVRHGYAPGWLLPGGGVERGETIFQAAVRELLEEAAVEAEEEPWLHGFYLNERQFRGDHVACLVLRKFRLGEFRRGIEIAEARFFPISALPDGTTGGTRRRIAEVTQGVAPSREW